MARRRVNKPSTALRAIVLLNCPAVLAHRRRSYVDPAPRLLRLPSVDLEHNSNVLHRDTAFSCLPLGHPELTLQM